MGRVGIIGGAGRMGAWFSKLLSSNDWKVCIYDLDLSKAEKIASTIGNVQVSSSLRELVWECDFLMITTPPTVTKSVILDISRLLVERPEPPKLLFDTSTFKREIVKAYTSVPIPRRCRVASAHPLFGPGAKIPERHVVAVIPIPGREDDSIAVGEFFKNLGFNIVIVDWETHDYYVSLTIGLPYAIAYSIAYYTSKLDIEIADRLAGTSYKYLRNYYKSVLREDLEFVKCILSNEYVKKHLEKYVEILTALSEGEALRGLSEVAEKHGGPKVLEDAYKKVYECLEG